MDTRFGIHTPSDYNWVPSNLIEWCEDAKRHGVNWITLWANCQVQVEFAKALTDHGIRIIYRPGQNLVPSQFIGGDLEKYREAGAEFCQFYNEPNLFGEWKDEKKASPEYFAELWAARCQSLKSIGFTPVVPPLSPGGNLYHREFFHRMMNWWKNQGMLPDLLRGCVLGIHNRPITNPPDDDGDCSFNEYKRYRQWMQEIMGFTLPMVAPEAGYEPQWVGYDWERWQDWNMELIRRFQPSHPKYVGADFLGSCFWIYDDLNSTWDHCSLVNNWRYGQDHGGDRTTNLWRALEAEDWGTVPVPPVPPPTPPPTPTPPLPPQPEGTMKAYLKDGSETDAGKLLEAYRVVIAPCTGPGFRVVEVRERCEAANCDVHVKGMGGELLVGQAVRWGWPGEEVSQETDPYGRVGFAMAASAKYDPALGGGPHWTAVTGNSETIRGIGMIMGTVHCTLNFVFQYLEGTPEPQPEPPTPEPPPEAYTLKGALNKRLEAAGLPPIQDVRPTILEKYVDLTRVGKRGLGPESLWSITFHHLPTLKTCLETDVLEVARYHTQTKKWPDIAYKLIVGFEDEQGKVPTFFTGLLAHYSEQSGYGRVNRYSIAVAVAGDFSIDKVTGKPKQSPTAGQLDALRCIVESLEEFVGGGRGQCHPLPIFRHYDLVSTECPGTLYEKYVARRDL